MSPFLPLAAAALALAGATAAVAKPDGVPATTAPAASAASTTGADAGLPRVVVIEDDNSRIEETRVRGALRSATVQSKVAGARPYTIQGNAGRDPSQERGNAGRRAWSIFDF
jgi:hypothetical protein